MTTSKWRNGTFYKLNLLYNVANTVDGSVFPEFNGQLLTDMHTEAQKFIAESVQLSSGHADGVIGFAPRAAEELGVVHRAGYTCEHSE